MGLFYLVQSVGSWLGVGLFEIAHEVNFIHIASNGDPLDKDIRMGSYFFLLAGVMFVTWLIFVIVSRRCHLPQYSQRKATFIVQQKAKQNARRTLSEVPSDSAGAYS